MGAKEPEREQRVDKPSGKDAEGGKSSLHAAKPATDASAPQARQRGSGEFQARESMSGSLVTSRALR